MKLKTKRNRTKKIPLVGVGCWTLGVGFIPAVAGGCGEQSMDERRKGGEERNANDVISCYLNNYLVKLN